MSNEERIATIDLLEGCDDVTFGDIEDLKERTVTMSKNFIDDCGERKWKYVLRDENNDELCTFINNTETDDIVLESLNL